MFLQKTNNVEDTYMANSNHLTTYMIWAPGYDEVPLGEATAGLLLASMRHLKKQIDECERHVHFVEEYARLREALTPPRGKRSPKA